MLRASRLLLLALPVLAGCHAAEPPSQTPSSPPLQASSSPPPAPAIERLDGVRLDAAAVDRTVERLMAAGRVPGLALAILNHGRVVHVKGYGLADVERGRPLTTRTVLYGASFTKSVFAYLVMQIVEEGRLDLDRPIAAYLPRPLPAYEKYADLAGDPRHERITARMLLSHTSGLPNWRFTRPDGKLALELDPGAKYSYSGEGINLLQVVVEEITGRPVGELMQERIFNRFGMTRTSMVWRSDFEDDFAVGYDEAGHPLGHKHRGSARAAGSMDTTITDFARFIAAMLGGEGLLPRTRSLMLSPAVTISSLHQFPTPSTETTDRDRAIHLSYGLGWGLFTSRHGPAYFKGGHDDGTENYSVSFDAPKSAIVIMTNSSNGESIFKELLSSLIADLDTPWEWESYIPYQDLPR